MFAASFARATPEKLLQFLTHKLPPDLKQDLIDTFGFKPSFQVLPKDIWRYILSFNDIDEIVRYTNVCKLFFACVFTCKTKQFAGFSAILPFDQLWASDVALIRAPRGLFSAMRNVRVYNTRNLSILSEGFPQIHCLHCEDYPDTLKLLSNFKNLTRFSVSNIISRHILTEFEYGKCRSFPLPSETVRRTATFGFGKSTNSLYEWCTGKSHAASLWDQLNTLDWSGLKRLELLFIPEKDIVDLSELEFSQTLERLDVYYTNLGRHNYWMSSLSNYESFRKSSLIHVCVNSIDVTVIAGLVDNLPDTVQIVEIQRICRPTIREPPAIHTKKCTPLDFKRYKRLQRVVIVDHTSHNFHILSCETTVLSVYVSVPSHESNYGFGLFFDCLLRDNRMKILHAEFGTRLNDSDRKKAEPVLARLRREHDVQFQVTLRGYFARPTSEVQI